MKVTISVGTHEQQFDRLVDLADNLTEFGHVVQIQYGYSRSPRLAIGRDFLPPSELERWIAASDLVFCHAGPATVLEALRLGVVPIVVPRDPDKGEHVDNHQIRFARHLQKYQMALVFREVKRVNPDELIASLSRFDVSDRGIRVENNRARLAESLNRWLGVP